MSEKKSWLYSFGNYPKEYNRAVHGRYYPFVNYGPRDTPFGEVKLGELQAWVARRNKKPYAIVAAFSRTFWWWKHTWMETRYGSVTKPLLQFVLLMSMTNFLLNYGHFTQHKMHKYHW